MKEVKFINSDCFFSARFKLYFNSLPYLIIAQDIGLNQTLLHKALTLAQRAKASLTIIANNQDKEIEQHLELTY
jgi:hypothetical protein